MNKETLINERNSCKRKVITFSILTGVCLILCFLFTLIFIILSVYLEINSSTGVATGGVVGGVIGAFVLWFLLFTLILAMMAFTPFIIINAIKLGKRNRLLRQMEQENG